MRPPIRPEPAGGRDRRGDASALPDAFDLPSRGFREALECLEISPLGLPRRSLAGERARPLSLERRPLQSFDAPQKTFSVAPEVLDLPRGLGNQGVAFMQRRSDVARADLPEG